MDNAKRLYLRIYICWLFSVGGIALWTAGIVYIWDTHTFAHIHKRAKAPWSFKRKEKDGSEEVGAIL